MHVALAQGWWAILGSLLRMELDSMIRVIYLLRTPDARKRILASCVAGKGFGAIRDRQMVDAALAQNPWADAVYKFGNRFVHLTDAHDYAEVDPFQTYEYRDEVITFLNKQHRGKVPGRPLGDNSTFHDIAAYAPHVLDKITSNLCGYLDDLRAVVSEN